MVTHLVGAEHVGAMCGGLHAVFSQRVLVPLLSQIHLEISLDHAAYVRKGRERRKGGGKRVQVGGIN